MYLLLLPARLARWAWPGRVPRTLGCVRVSGTMAYCGIPVVPCFPAYFPPPFAAQHETRAYQCDGV